MPKIDPVLASKERVLKAKIDAMTQEELCRKWRFAPVGDPMLQGAVGDYFEQKLKESGGIHARDQQEDWMVRDADT